MNSITDTDETNGVPSPDLTFFAYDAAANEKWEVKSRVLIEFPIEAECSMVHKNYYTILLSSSSQMDPK